MYQQIITLFINSSDKFLDSQEDLILSGVSERNLCGALMTIIRSELDNTELENYHADIEYNRNFDGKIKTIINNNMEVVNITCDLIIHSRGENEMQDNLIAIEMKRDTHKEDDKNSDKIRLKALTKNKNDTNTYSADGKTFPEHVCGYILGVFYEISMENRNVKIEYYRNGAHVSTYTRNF